MFVRTWSDRLLLICILEKTGAHLADHIGGAHFDFAYAYYPDSRFMWLIRQGDADTPAAVAVVVDA